MRLTVLISFIFLASLFSINAYGQGLTCAEAQPFCAGDSSLLFENTFSSGTPNQAEVGPNYGCLDEQPNPAWYYIQIDQPGDLFFLIEQNSESDFTGAPLDVDFIAWGPFTQQEFRNGVCSDLTAVNQVPGSFMNQGNITTSQGCSYSQFEEENFNILGANTGEIYVLLIANYENEAGFIRMQQINATQSSGSTDCSIVNSVELCEGDVSSVDATTTNGVRYEWFQDDILLPAETTPTLINLVAPSASYKANVYDSGDNLINTYVFNLNFFPIPIPVPVTDQFICDDNGDGFWNLDLSLVSPIVLGGQSASEFSVSYHSSQLDADANENPLSGTYINQQAYTEEEIFIRLENIGNPSCFSTTSFLFDVFDVPVVTAVEYSLCDNDTDGDDANGYVEFDLSSIYGELLGAQNLVQYNFSFYISALDADLDQNPLPSLYTNGVVDAEQIYVRVENIDYTDCFSTGVVDLIVDPLPLVLPIVELRQCDNDTDGYTQFNLTEVNEQLSTNYLNEVFTYYLDMNDAENGVNAILNPTAYTNTDASSNADVLYVRTETTNGCYRISQLDLIVSTTLIPLNYLLTYQSCDNELDDGDARNGIIAFDFTDATSQIEGIFPIGQDIIVSYYESEADALAEENEIMDISNFRNENSPDDQYIYVRVDSNIDNSCLGLGPHIRLLVNPLPVVELDGEYLVCINVNGTEEVNQPLLETGLSTSNYTFEWQNSSGVIVGTASSYSPNLGGNYTVYVTDISTGCTESDTVLVAQSEPPIVNAEVVSIAFAERHVVEATASGLGDYEFRIDGGPWQTESLFENVSAGWHLIEARDKNGCGLSGSTVLVIDYPHFFTPNDDGYHDTWNIVGIATQPEAKVFIYDRYGKLLKQLNPYGQGWNGTFNGHPLPSSDYWFTVEYREASTNTQKLFKAHFALKR